MSRFHCESPVLRYTIVTLKHLVILCVNSGHYVICNIPVIFNNI